MKIKALFVLLFIGLFTVEGVFAQADSTIIADARRNVIKWNMTPFFLWSKKNINFSYERILKHNHSFSVNMGYFELPSLGIADNLNLEKESYKRGLSVSGDFRFYPAKRNLKGAPDGIYFGPYASYHFTQFGTDVTVLDSQIATGSFAADVNLSIMSAGFELGYQFVFKRGFTLDLIFMGPSVSIYTGKITLDGDLTVDENNENLEKIREALVSKYPFLDELISEGEFNDSGISTSLGFGMRYMIQIGYNF
jgi:hypothetical protein